MSSSTFEITTLYKLFLVKVNHSVYLTTTTYVRHSGRLPLEHGVDGQPHKTPHFHPRHQHPPPIFWNDPPKKSLGLAKPPPHRCRTFPLLLVQMGYGPLCGLWVWRRRTNRRPCCPPMSNPSTSPWTAWPDDGGRWDNRMTAQYLPRDLVRPSSGFNNSLKRKKLDAINYSPLQTFVITQPLQKNRLMLFTIPSPQGGLVD